MKKGLIVLLSAAFMLSCATVEDYENAIGDPDLPLVPEASSGDLADFDESVFGLINLDYPGLENVRYFYENGDAYSAGVELLKYYRSRSVIDPSVVTTTPMVECSLITLRVPTSAARLKGTSSSNHGVLTMRGALSSI